MAVRLRPHEKLAEHAMEKLKPFYQDMKSAWTKTAPLPGGDIANADFDGFFARLNSSYPNVDESYLHHLARAYGTKVHDVFKVSETIGKKFGPFMSDTEAKYLINAELAKSAEDVMWRRTKSGLHMSETERKRFKTWFKTLPCRKRPKCDLNLVSAIIQSIGPRINGRMMPAK